MLILYLFLIHFFTIKLHCKPFFYRGVNNTFSIYAYLILIKKTIGQYKTDMNQNEKYNEKT